MNQYATAKELFSDDFDLSGYFDSLTFEYAKKSLVDAITAHDTPLIFLLGNPGTGKSFLLRLISEEIPSIKIAKFFTNPYYENKEFLESLLSLAGKNIQKDSLTTEALITALQNNFSNLEYTIFIDESQLLSEEQIELIRILSDLKIFQFVLAMHQQDGDKILQKDHFKSRTTRRVLIEELQDHEISRYIESRLISNNLSDLASEFKNRHIAFIAKFANRNFRTTKKLIKTLFEIMNIANREGFDKSYTKVNKKTLTMAAIDIGLIDVE
jgi:dephospho-CoA kinase